ncbi:MAG: hypothetical protein KQH83_03695 [Actinobacteria bacterium]|nr:hypothetical protein [Actinomycetota bacterium]
MGTSPLAARLEAVWQQQIDDGYLLGDPRGPVETRTAADPDTGVAFRFRWLPHRAVRGVAAVLAEHGIYDPGCEDQDLPVDRRDPAGRPCFLCAGMIRPCFPKEVLVPLQAGGRDWLAGANFAWLGRNHFTVASAAHEDQRYDPGVLAAMLDLHRDTGGAFRVVYNGAGAGSSIPWHLHLQMTTDPFPVEALAPGADARYPLPLRRFFDAGEADAAVGAWHGRDPSHRVNLMVAGPGGAPVIHLFYRDSRRPASAELGAMASFEACGDMVFDDPARREAFEQADLAMVRRALADITPRLGDAAAAGA